MHNTTTFSCDECGKSYPWKPAIAGKKAKCGCGRIVTVPQSAPTAADESDLYALAELPPEPVVPFDPPPRPPTRLAYEPPVRDRFSFDALTHPPRDIYIPTALLTVGFLAVLVGAIVRYPLPPAMLAIVSLLTGVTVIIKTIIVVGLAIMIAPHLGVSFGLLWTAILKFAAILIFTDAVTLWLDVIMQANGAMSSSGRITRGVVTIHLLAACTIVTVLVRYLFDMDREETGMVAVPLAGVSLFIGFLLWLLLLGILEAIVAPAAPSPAPASAAVAPIAAPIASSPIAADSPADIALASRIKKSLFVAEAREHNRRQASRIKGHRELADRAYGAGAKKVYFDLEGSRRLQPVKAYIELPSELSVRSACFAVLGATCDEFKFGLAPAGATDTGQRFVTVVLEQ